MVIDNILKDYETTQNELDLEINDCLKIFKNFTESHKLEPDMFFTARAFTSLINTLVNKKIEYINYLLSCQIEVLSFLKTYDDKYLSSIEGLLIENTTSEMIAIEELIENCYTLTFFLNDLLNDLIKKNNFNSLERNLEQLLQECEKKFKEEN